MRLIDADSFKQILNQETIGGIIVASIIDTRPTIDPKPQWIPVAERLPEENVSVLATVSGMPSTNVTLYKTVVIAENFGNEGWHVEEWPDWEDASPDYWMPLPEPYEPEDAKMEDNS